jgi:hypothetical protein
MQRTPFLLRINNQERRNPLCSLAMFACRNICTHQPAGSQSKAELSQSSLSIKLMTCEGANINASKYCACGLGFLECHIPQVAATKNKNNIAAWDSVMDKQGKNFSMDINNADTICMDNIQCSTMSCQVLSLGYHHGSLGCLLHQPLLLVLQQSCISMKTTNLEPKLPHSPTNFDVVLKISSQKTIFGVKRHTQQIKI